MRLRIDYNSDEPITRQAVAQIKLLAVSGQLVPGEKLPSIRGLAHDLQINPTTVSRIYNELAGEGVIVLRQGQGAYVAEGAPPLARREVRRLLGAKARDLLVEGLRHGLSMDEIRRTLDEEYDDIRGDDA
jgi:DNA-binding transcriptional regulator YhcF (GntR family)